MYKKIKRVHLIGVGGIGMSGLALLLQRHGYEVSGSDLNASELTRQLSENGIDFFLGHDASHLRGAELVVYSSAVNAANVEFARAKEMKLPLISRAELLAELMRLKYGIAVAGAHGKTTTTSMVGLVLLEGGLDPTVIVGGRVDHFGGTNARLGDGEFIVAEADESDGSFNRLSPTLAVITNLDREHMDHYGNIRTLKNAFVSFMNKVPFYGIVVACGDDPYLKTLLPKIDRRKFSYGFEEANDLRIEEYTATPEGSKVKLRLGGNTFAFDLRVPGKHNALNATAAFAIGLELGISPALITGALEKFRGVRRRFEYKGQRNGVTFIDDYAHHPTEIGATLQAARERFPRSKINVIFQPHRYSRLSDLFDEFSRCFHKCDSVTITDIYAAGEEPIPGISSGNLVDNIARTGTVAASHISTPALALRTVADSAKEGEIVLTLGAGDLPHAYRDFF